MQSKETPQYDTTFKTLYTGITEAIKTENLTNIQKIFFCLWLIAAWSIDKVILEPNSKKEKKSD